MTELLTRFVVAIEAIATALTTLAKPPEEIIEETPLPENVHDAVLTDVTQPSYDRMTLEQLKSLCAARGIELKKGTRMNTMANLLKEFDAQPALVENELKDVAVNTIEEDFVDIDEDPFAGDDDVDPFEDEEKVYSFREVRAELQKLITPGDNTGAKKIGKILKDVCGVKKLKDIQDQEDKFSAIIAAAKKELANG